MAAFQLTGTRVTLMISDPWDFGTECGVGPFYGKIADIGTEKIDSLDIEKALINLERSIKYSGVSYVSAICYIRHEGSSFDNLQGKATVAVNVSLTPAQAKSFTEIKDEDLRNGFEAIGSLEVS